MGRNICKLVVFADAPPSSIIDIMYGGLGPANSAIITIPLVLYQGSQLVLGQIEVMILARWNRRFDVPTSVGEKDGEANLASEDTTPARVHSAV